MKYPFVVLNVLLTSFMFAGCWHDINCLPDSHFTDEGKIKSGSVVIKSYDSSGNLLQESQVIKEKNAEGSFNTGYGGEKVKVTVEFTDFKGEFKMYR